MTFMPSLPLIEDMVNEAMASEGHPPCRPVTRAEVEELKSLANSIQVALQCVTRPGWQEPEDRTELELAKECAGDLWSQVYRLGKKMDKEG